MQRAEACAEEKEQGKEEEEEAGTAGPPWQWLRGMRGRLSSHDAAAGGVMCGSACVVVRGWSAPHKLAPRCLLMWMEDGGEPQVPVNEGKRA